MGAVLETAQQGSVKSGRVPKALFFSSEIPMGLPYNNDASILFGFWIAAPLL